MTSYLSRLIDENDGKFELGQSWVSSAHTRTADHICILRTYITMEVYGLLFEGGFYLIPTTSSSRSHRRLSVRNLFSSDADSSPVSSFMCCSLRSSGYLEQRAVYYSAHSSKTSVYYSDSVVTFSVFYSLHCSNLSVYLFSILLGAS